MSALRLALSIISGRVDPDGLDDGQYGLLGFTSRHHPEGLEPSFWVTREEALERSEDIVAQRMEGLQREVDSKSCAHANVSFGTCSDCGLIGV